MALRAGPPFRWAAAADRVPPVNPAVKWVGSAIAIPVLAIGIYLGAVLQVYAIAWVVEIIGRIF